MLQTHFNLKLQGFREWAYLWKDSLFELQFSSNLRDYFQLSRVYQDKQSSRTPKSSLFPEIFRNSSLRRKLPYHCCPKEWNFLKILKITFDNENRKTFAIIAWKLKKKHLIVGGNGPMFKVYEERDIAGNFHPVPGLAIYRRGFKKRAII